MAPQFLPPCVCTACFRLRSSDSVHASTRPAARSMLGSKISFHLYEHCFSTQRGDCGLILATVHLYRILQLVIFVFCPCIRTCLVTDRCCASSNVPSVITLLFRSTRNQSGNCDPICPVILAPLHLAGIRKCTSQFCIFRQCLESSHSGWQR
jgi:hypothetical protein